MIPAAIQPKVPFEHPDAPVDARAEPKAAPEPALPFIRLPRLGPAPGFRQANLLDLQFAR
jgi:hypothetical protein